MKSSKTAWSKEMRRRTILVDEEVRELVRKAIECVGSKRALSAELGHTSPDGTKVSAILNGARKTLSAGQLRRLKEIVGERSSGGRAR